MWTDDWSRPSTWVICSGVMKIVWVFGFSPTFCRISFKASLLFTWSINTSNSSKPRTLDCIGFQMASKNAICANDFSPPEKDSTFLNRSLGFVETLSTSRALAKSKSIFPVNPRNRRADSKTLFTSWISKLAVAVRFSSRACREEAKWLCNLTDSSYFFLMSL
ncbi:hypothetical protein OGAPHI_006194 [Ogataea philodendri]|uniref:Uncharacterized protein n=1 Tax=Ogataea philodendri TaxID=1378263 RepID=A0A9P8T0Q5_9ASCO|nr:uncharacterized protein OGAPHI_006194 [Ogataea philodendri]KAH3662013.1 hypothetical protein OGAPHI_006194 [Ogataea philodendri]